MSNVTYAEHAAGLTWVCGDPLTRTSHALAHDGRVWLIDPVDDAEALERAHALGKPTAIVQLLDRHPRDCAALALRLEVPVHRLPDRLPDAPFEVVDVLGLPLWREKALWWPATRTLVVAEVVGTNDIYTTGRGPAGIHPFLRARPPGVLRRFTPENLLVGHGPGVHGAAAAAALEHAYARTRADLPRLLVQLPGIARRTGGSL